MNVLLLLEQCKNTVVSGGFVKSKKRTQFQRSMSENEQESQDNSPFFFLFSWAPNKSTGKNLQQRVLSCTSKLFVLGIIMSCFSCYPFVSLTSALEHRLFWYELYLKRIHWVNKNSLVDNSILLLFSNFWRNNWTVLLILFNLLVWIYDRKEFNKNQSKRILIHMKRTSIPCLKGKL